MKNENRICLGKIVGAQGIKGEVKIKSFMQDPEDIDQYGDLESKDGSKKFSIKVTGFSKGTVRATVKGCIDRNMAEALSGTELWVSKDLLPELEEDEFYHQDLIGLEVRLETSGEKLGKVIGVYDFGAGDLLEVEMSKSNTSEMFPFKESFVPKINIKEGYVIVSDIILDFIGDNQDEETNEG